MERVGRPAERREPGGRATPAAVIDAAGEAVGSRAAGAAEADGAAGRPPVMKMAPEAEGGASEAGAKEGRRVMVMLVAVRVGSRRDARPAVAAGGVAVAGAAAAVVRAKDPPASDPVTGQGRGGSVGAPAAGDGSWAGAGRATAVREANAGKDLAAVPPGKAKDALTVRRAAAATGAAVVDGEAATVVGTSEVLVPEAGDKAAKARAVPVRTAPAEAMGVVVSSAEVATP